VYKLGDCFRNKHTGHLVEIIEVHRTNDGIDYYLVKKLNKSIAQTFHVNYSLLQDNYEKSNLAQVLYSNKSNK
jgi:hypothetical protein